MKHGFIRSVIEVLSSQKSEGDHFIKCYCWMQDDIYSDFTFSIQFHLGIWSPGERWVDRIFRLCRSGFEGSGAAQVTSASGVRGSCQDCKCLLPG